MPRSDNCLLCGRPLDLDSALDQSIIWETTREFAICRECFELGAYQSLPNKDKGLILLEEGINTEDVKYKKKCLQDSIAAQPTADACSYLASLTEDKEMALSLYERALGLESENIMAICGVVPLLAAMGKYQEALEWVRQHAVVDAGVLKARLLLSMGHIDQAEATFLDELRNCASEDARNRLYDLWNEGNRWDWP